MKTAYVKHILSLLMFGTNGIVASFILLNSYEIVFFRTLMGGALLLLLFKLGGGKFHISEHKKDALFIALSGISMGASWMFLYEAYQEIGVSISTLIYYTGPVIVMILSPVIFKERLTLPKIIGFVTVLAGLVLINGTVGTEERNVWGIFCAFMSAVMYFFMVTFNKKSEKITGMENTIIQLAVSFVTVACFVMARQGVSMELGNVNWIAVLILGFLNSGIGCYLYFSTLSKLPVQSVAVLGYLEALSAVLFSAMFLSERLTGGQIIGAVCIIGGAMIGELVKINSKNCHKVIDK